MTRRGKALVVAAAVILNLVAAVLYFSLASPSDKYKFPTHGAFLKPATKAGKAKLPDATETSQYPHETNIAHNFHEFVGETIDGANPDTYERENATMVTLCRNSDLESVTRAIMSVEHTWNWKYGYPYIFVNNEEFTDEFIKVTSSLVREAHYEIIPKEQWSTPSWIDEEKAAAGRQLLENIGIPYASNVPYRHMCRFFSGFFYRTPLTSKYKYILRLDNDVMHLCKLSWDPFKYMRETGTKYGFTIALYEFHETVATLWEDTLKFAQSFPQYINPQNLARFVSEDHGQSYNNCHFWSNFELIDADFFRGEAYTKYFEYLDKIGGFYHERWGDAPVHSIAASLFLSRDEIHFFESIGYVHKPFSHIPADFADRGMMCYASPGETFDFNGNSCLRHFLSAKDEELPLDVDKVYY